MSQVPHDIDSDTHIEKDDVSDSPPSGREIRAFALPSLLGILAFLTPIQVDGNWTILMGWLSAEATTFVGETMTWVVFGLLWISTIGTVLIQSRAKTMIATATGARKNFSFFMFNFLAGICTVEISVARNWTAVVLS